MNTKPNMFRALPHFVVAGLAMFSMFFGSGNLVFPLDVGRTAGEFVGTASFGLFLTAILVPFIGLLGLILFDGDYKPFFARMGKVPGFLVTACIITLIGPLGVVPRCIAVSFGSFSSIVDVDIYLFCGISCVSILLFTWSKERLLDLLGYILTPLLLVSLILIIVAGVIISPAVHSNDLSASVVFSNSVMSGYGTMDLLGAFFFSSIVVKNLKSNLSAGHSSKELITTSAKAGSIGAILLSVIYFGFVYLSAHFAPQLDGIAAHELLPQLSKIVLGEVGSIVVSCAVALACLSTAASLMIVFIQFVQKDIPCGTKIPYPLILGISLLGTFFVAVQDFSGIMSFMAPILYLCYPALIVLSICNILYKLFGFTYVLVPVYVTFAISIVVFFGM